MLGSEKVQSGKARGFRGVLMGIVANRNARSRQLAFILLASACLAMFQSGCSKVQDIDRLREAAEQGDAEAQNKLGAMYAYGERVPEDSREAVKWFRKAAEQGFAKAQYNLGVMYSKGKGVAEDDQEAVKWYHKAAEQGYASAQHNLGNMYLRGEGVAEDNQVAVKWYRKAAEQGYASAQFKLGFMYSEGEGLPENDQEAVTWYRKAAEQGFALGQLSLGYMYFTGKGVPRDYSKAYSWLNLAAAQGNKTAAKVKGQLKAIMTAEQLAKAEGLATEQFNPIGGMSLPPPTEEQLATRKEREHKVALKEQKTSVEGAPSKPKREKTLSEKMTMGDKLDPEDNLTIIADPSWDQRESYRRRFRFLLSQFDENCPDLEGKEHVGDTLVNVHMQLIEAGLGSEEGLLKFSNTMHRMVTEIGTQARMAEMPLPGCVQFWAMYTTTRNGGFSPEESRGAVTAMANLAYTAAMEK